MKTFYLCFIFSCSVFLSIGQDTNTIVGWVTDEAHIPVSDAFVSINWSKKGLHTKEDGSFSISIASQDTIVIKHLSFEPKAIAVSSLLGKDSIRVQLRERTFSLGEVEVTNWGDWQDFKHKITYMDADSIRNTDNYRLKTMFHKMELFPEDKYAERLNSKTKLPHITQKQLNPYGVSFTNIASTGLNKKSKKNPNKEIALKRNKHKYSKKLLSKILNLKGNDLKKFKSFCDYYINLNQNEYKILQQIKSLYKEWKESEVYHLKSDSMPKIKDDTF